MTAESLHRPKTKLPLQDTTFLRRYKIETKHRDILDFSRQKSREYNKVILELQSHTSPVGPLLCNISLPGQLEPQIKCPEFWKATKMLF